MLSTGDSKKVLGPMDYKITGKNFSYHSEPLELSYTKRALAHIEKNLNLPCDLSPEDQFIEGNVSEYSDDVSETSLEQLDMDKEIPEAKSPLKMSEGMQNLFAVKRQSGMLTEDCGYEGEVEKSEQAAI